MPPHLALVPPPTPPQPRHDPLILLSTVAFTLGLTLGLLIDHLGR